MKNLANEILEFFSIDIENIGEKKTPKSIDEFVSQSKYEQSLDLIKFFKIVNIFKQEGMLLSIGIKPSGKIPVTNEILVAPNYNSDVAKYGSYQFIVDGFSSIAESFSESVKPIVIVDNDGNPDIGTGFLIGNKHTIITARHVIDNAKKITITNSKGEIAKAKTVTFPKNKNIDLALILIDDFTFSTNKHFNGTNANILENVLTIGYPPIPGFDAFQLYELSSINNSYKFSNGQIIGKETSYLDSIEYLILNAKVKGGNSGSPVINNKGNVVGMVVQIPMDSEDYEKIDRLGYGIVTPTSEILKHLLGGEKSDEMLTYNCLNEEGGFKIEN